MLWLPRYGDDVRNVTSWQTQLPQHRHYFAAREFATVVVLRNLYCSDIRIHLHQWNYERCAPHQLPTHVLSTTEIAPELCSKLKLSKLNTYAKTRKQSTRAKNTRKTQVKSHAQNTRAKHACNRQPNGYLFESISHRNFLAINKQTNRQPNGVLLHATLRKCMDTHLPRTVPITINNYQLLSRKHA